MSTTTKSPTAVPELPASAKALLRFAARYESLTDEALRPLVMRAFGLSLLSYRQRLYVAVVAPGAEAVEPALVRRLRATIERRKRKRAAGAHPRPRPRGA